MKVLVKLGGSLLDSPDLRAVLAQQIVAHAQDTEMTVVHGGGKQMTRYLAERGIESTFVNGLRVTTPETMDGVLKVFAGSVNQELVAALIAAGARAVGLTGIDGNLVEADQMDPRLGQVGRVTGVNAQLLDILVMHGYLPVVACVAGDRAGRIYNINADQMAAACAGAWGADRLIFLTDIGGVLDAAGQVQYRLTTRQCEDLIALGTATGGMQAKLTAANAALDQGVASVQIAPGAAPDILARLLSDQAVGTRIVLPVDQVTFS